MLTAEEKNHFTLLSVVPGTMIIVRQSDHDLLLQAELHNGWLARGWYRAGDGPPDVQWVKETMTGWPKAVR